MGLSPPQSTPSCLCVAGRYADVIIPWQRGDNIVAIDLITEHIKLKLQQHDLVRIYPNLEVIPSTYQVSPCHGQGSRGARVFCMV
jgi:hypothetical protein